MNRIIYLILLFFLFSLSSPCSALVIFDFEQMYFFEKNYRVKDHCFVKIDTLYHLYYIRAPLAPDGPQFEDSLGHAISTDLIHWTILPPVISVQPGTWENEAVWAPHVIQGLDMKYYMFYTGVNSSIAQATGLATSTDGFTWIKWPGNPVYIPDTTWAQWSTNSWSDCRDPFIFFENGLYYMLITTKSKTGQATIACATSTDLVNWTDRGPIYAHEAPDYSNPLESVFLLKRFDKYHLFFSEYPVGGTSYISSDSLLSGWNLSRRVILDLGGAAEIVDDSGTELFSRYTCFPVGGAYWYAIKLDTLVWENQSPRVSIPGPLQRDWRPVWGTAFHAQSTFGDNTYVRSGIPSGLQGNSWIGTYERFQGPLQPTTGLAGDYQGDVPVGELRSGNFVLDGSNITLSVGGGSKPDSEFVALCDACDDRAIFSETGKNSETMDLRTWNIGLMRGRNVYIKVVDASSSPFGHINVDNISENGQSSTTPQYPTVTVLEPNGGEVWDEQSQHGIWWVAAGTNGLGADSVSLFYSIDDGFRYIPIVRGLRGDPPYYWNLPSTPSDQCIVRVTAYTKAPFGWCDWSDQDFKIRDITPPQVSVLAPAAGDTLRGGTATVISWAVTDNGTIDSTNIYLSVDAGRTYPYVIITGLRSGGLSGSSSDFQWNIPYSYYSDSCRISVTSYDRGLNAGTGESDLFRILRLSDVNRSDRSPLTLSFTLNAAPNPFSSEIVITFSLPLPGKTRADIFNVKGENVRTLFSGTSRGGNHTLVWDGRDSNRSPLPSGVYLIRVESEKDALTRKIVLLK
ncbi:MAG: FlgD immunoglobulin-like domain containing protein [Candidatus Eisenbacteria bacterium]|nr:FlgD immunoglobulin-like domain containing protein [Candidatus Eisenbacteria bacterium]